MAKTNPLEKRMYVLIRAEFQPDCVNVPDLEYGLTQHGFDTVEILEFDFVKEKPEDITNRDGEIGGK